MRRMSECVLLYARSLTHSSRYSHLAYAQSLTTTKERGTHYMDPGMNGKNGKHGEHGNKPDMPERLGMLTVWILMICICAIILSATAAILYTIYRLAFGA